MKFVCLQPRILLLSCCVFLWVVTYSKDAHSGAVPTTTPGNADIAKMTPSTPILREPLNAHQAPQENPDKKSGDVSVDGADQIFFKFNRIVFKGMDAYPPDRFLPLSTPLIGKDVSLQQVINIINEVNGVYRQDGFIFSYFYLPEQDITNGVVTVSVVEGRVANVLLDDTIRAPNALKEYTKKIASIYPFNIRRFEQVVLHMNTLAGAKFQTILRPPKDKVAGGIDIAIVETREKVVSTVSVDNYGSKYAGPWQVSANAGWDSLLAPYDELNVNISATYPLKEVKFAGLNYKAPVRNFTGLSFKAGVSWGGTHSGSNLNEFDLGGLSREAYLSLQYDHILTRRDNWTSALKFNIKNTRSKILGTELYDDRTRSIDLSTTWQHIDDWNGASLINLSVNQGLNVFGVRETGSDNLSRDDGHSDYTKLKVEATRLQDFPYDVQGIFSFSGQYSFDPLLSGEEFSYGGSRYGRGLDPSELTGDHGLSASAELRYRGLRPYGHYTFLPYAFLDFGKVWQKGLAAANPQSAATTGFGLRVNHENSIDIDAMMALPLTMGTSNSEGYRNSESPRYLIRITKAF